MLAARVLRRQRLPVCRLEYPSPVLATTLSSRCPRAKLLPAAPRHHQQRRHYQSEDEIRERLRHARPLLSHTAADRFTTTGRGRNSRVFVIGCVVAAAVFYFFNSQKVPVTGRRRFNFLSDRFVVYLGAEGAEDVVQMIKAQGGRFLPPRDWRYREVQRVMARLVPVSGMADVDWKIQVIDDESET
jgi:hypothetical protein